jgi:filamentous hemagglutinin family protein
MTAEPTEPYGIIVDKSFGAEQTKELQGPNYHIYAEMGKTKGENLFHSFQKFNLHEQESAIFYGDDSISRIISRVTGPESSWIDGGIISNAPHADIYFINPKGVIFGPNAWLDVQQSFHVSTCDYLGFSDQTRYKVNETDPLLSSASPVSFGFLDSDIGSIHIDGKGAVIPTSENNVLPSIYVPEGHHISLIGGHMQLDFGTVDLNTYFPIGTLIAEKGRINIASVASVGEVLIETDQLIVSSCEQLGDIQMLKHSAISSGSGQIFIRANELIIDQSFINAGQYSKNDSTPEGFAGGSIDIQVHQLSVLNGSAILIETFGKESSGDINIIADHVRVDGLGSDNTGSSISTSSIELDNLEQEIISNDQFKASHLSTINPAKLQNGNAGNIYINAINISISNGGLIEANAFSLGNGGNIVLNASQSIDISGIPNVNEACGIMAVARSDQKNSGDAGNISIQSKYLHIHDGAKIINSTAGVGNGGRIDISVEETFVIEGSKGSCENFQEEQIFQHVSGVFSTTDSDHENAGNAGKISISGKNFCMNHYANINASSESKGDAGEIVLDFETFSIEDYSGIFSQSMHEGNSGFVFIKAGQFISLKNQAGISVQSMSKGRPGGIAIDTPELTMEDQTIITSASLSPDNETDGGGVLIGRDVSVDELEFDVGQACHKLKMNNLSKITTESHGKGSAGYIYIKSQSIQMDDHTQISSSSLLNDKNGNSGYIFLQTENLSLMNDSSITTENSGEGDAGFIFIDTHQLNLTNHSAILSVNTHGQNGGMSGFIMISKQIESLLPGDQMSVHPCDYISIDNNSGITTSSLSEGGAGGIMVRTKTLNMSNSGFISAENKYPELSQEFGIVSIRSDMINMQSHSKISTLSEGDGDAGGIAIETGKLFMSDAIISSAGVTSGKKGEGGHIIMAREIANLDNFLFGLIDDITQPLEVLYFTNPVDRISLVNNASISTSSAGYGNAGRILIDAVNLTMADNATISSESSSLVDGGAAGFIKIRKIDYLSMVRNSSISTQAKNTSVPDIISPDILKQDRLNGSISIEGFHSDIHLIDSSITSSVLGGFGNGGNIDISSYVLLMNHSKVIANAFDGNGGNIQMTSNYMIQSADSMISASSERGIDGEIVIETSIQRPDKGLIKLPSTFLDAQKWIKTPCEKRDHESVSRLIIRQIDAHPTPFNDWVPAYWRKN